MKKQVLCIVGLALLSTSAFASKARLGALGQGNTSMLVNDARNVLLNPAVLNDNKDYVVIEWGSNNGAGGSAENDAEETPKAEGGFFKSVGSFAYGVYLGDETNTAATNRDAVESSLTGDTAFLNEDNKVSFFLAGDAGIQWGAGFSYSSNEDEQAQSFVKEQSGMALKLGVIVGDLDVYVNYTLKDESIGATLGTDRYEDDGTMDFGTGYKFGDFKGFVTYAIDAYVGNFGSTTREGSTNSMVIGIGQVQKINDKAIFVASISYENADIEAINGTVKTETKAMAIPLKIGLEAEATSWLTLRGSVAQNIKSSEERNDKKAKTSENSIAANVGATLNFGNMKIDGLIGTDSDSNNQADTVKTGSLHTNNLMTRVSMNYFF